MSEEEDLTTFGKRLRAARKAKKLSQARLANLVGISQPMVSELESDEYSGSSYTAQLAQVVGVSPLWLAERRGPRHPSQGAASEEAQGRERSDLHRALDEMLDRAGPDGAARVKAMLDLISLATGGGKSGAFTEAVALSKRDIEQRNDSPTSPLPSNVRAPHFPSTRGRLIPPPTRKHAPAPTKPKSPGKAGGSGGRK